MPLVCCGKTDRLYDSIIHTLKGKSKFTHKWKHAFFSPMDGGDSNIGPYACMIDAFITKPPPTPHLFLKNNYIGHTGKIPMVC